MPLVPIQVDTHTGISSPRSVGATATTPIPTTPKPAARTNHDKFFVRALGSDGAEVEGYPAHWRPENPFAQSPRVLLTDAPMTARERRQRIEEMEEQAAHGIIMPRLILPTTTARVKVESGQARRPGDVLSAQWQIVHLAWQDVPLSLPEDWSVPQDLLETFPGYDWERLRGYELQPWASQWAMPWREWPEDFGKRTQGSPIEPIWKYVRITEKLPFPDDSEDSMRFMSLLVRTHDPDPWIGHRIFGRNLWPAAAHPTNICAVNPNTTNGFRRTAKNTATKPKAKRKK